MRATVDVDVDYLIVGAGAMGMAFADALVNADTEATVAIVDRRHAAGGHWLDAYPFVRLHQASAFYGVASTLLGGGRVQTSGPEAGLHERATAPEICLYYSRVMDALVGTGRVAFHPRCEYAGGTRFRSLVSGRHFDARGARVVDAAYLAPTIPSITPPPFAVEGAKVVPVNDLVRLAEAPTQYVIVGAGKTATDACVWLLQNGVDPNAVCWVRPRDPWLLNRAVVQPDPAVFLGMAADTMEIAALARSPDDIFLRLEEHGVMMRIDRSILPTMAKTPTIAEWELDLLRRIENVVRHGHVRAARPGRLRFDDADVRIDPDALIVHCAASGLRYAPLVPIWQPDAIRPRPVRVGFPCFGAAIAGYVEATRDDDAAKNDACRPSPYSNTPADWVRMQIIGGDASMAMSREPDLKAWANTTTLNPVRVTPAQADVAAVRDAASRLRAAVAPGRERLASLIDVA